MIGKEIEEEIEKDRVGIIIVGHGSRVPESKMVYEEIARMVGERSGMKVQVGYMKHWEPNFTKAINTFIREGAKKLIVVPLFFLPGTHVREDIPVLLGLKEGEVPEFGYDRIELPDDVEIIYTKHIGADERLADVVLDRVKDAL